VQKHEELVFSDDFKGGKLTTGWQWPVGRLPNIRFSPDADGALLLAPGDRPSRIGGVIARSCTSGDYTAITEVDTSGQAAGTSASLSAFGDPGNAIGLAVVDGHAVLWRMQKGQRTELARSEALPGSRVHLRMNATGGALFQFSFSHDGNDWKSIGEAVDCSDLPPWDRAIRIALIGSGGEARFTSFKISPQQ
jgi:hypothetical protein